MRATVAFAVPLMLVAVAAHGAPARSPDDERDLARLRADHPAAADQIVRGEELAIAGDARAALDLFARAAEEASGVPLPARRECEAQIMLGHRLEAIEACRRATPNVRTPVSARALIRAWMAGPEAPPVDDLTHAFLLADDVRKQFPTEPWGHAAMCDIAQRIGDDVMLQRCSEALARVAPGHIETEQAVAAVRALRPSWAIAAGWLVIAAASLATLVHAAWSRRRRAVTALAAGSGLACALLFASSPALAEPSPDHPGSVSNWPVNDDDPVSSIPSAEKLTKDPLEFGYWLQDLIARGQAASKRGDHAAAAKYFTALATAVPDRAAGFSHLCTEAEAIGDHDKAVAACANALYKPGVAVSDYLHYMRLIMMKTGDLTPPEVASLTAVVQHLKEDPATHDQAEELECEVATRTHDAAQLADCTAALAVSAPNAPTTLVYQWTLAMQHGDYAGARKLLERAPDAKVTPAVLDRLRHETDDAVARRVRRTTMLVVSAFLVLVAAAAALRFLRRRTPDVETPVVATS